MVQPTSITSQIIKTLKDAQSQKVLDIGCGNGGLTSLLIHAGFEMTGIDPSQEAVSSASQNIPEAEFFVAGGEDIPLPENFFDSAVLLNSFHHIPQDDLAKSLQEFKRVLKPDGELIIAEPLCHGSFFEAMRPIEDETEVREFAWSVLNKAIATPDWELVSRQEVERESSFDSVEKFIEKLVAVEPTRQEAARARKTEIQDLFSTHATRRNDSFILVQPHVIWQLKSSTE